MDAHTLQVVEFDRVRQLLADHANCALGKRMALKVKPVNRAALIRQWLGQLDQMFEVAAAIGLPPFGGVHDIRGAVRAAVPPHSLEPEDFAVLAETFDATHEIAGWVGRIGPYGSELAALGDEIGDFKALAETIHRVVSAKGEVRDDASAKLNRIRIEIAKSQVKIGQVIDRLIRDRRATRWLRYPQATFHEDRLVLPLAAEHRGRVPGIVHRSSDSGSTLFVEPAEAVELNNLIAELKNDERAEISRLLWHLTHQVHLNSKEILKTMDRLAVLDFIVAKVRFAWSFEMNCPQIGDDRQLHLKRARHPLLVELHKQAEREGSAKGRQPVVPIDVRLSEDFDVLVITGPNTGGKTVALKTIALCCVMAQSGLAIPAGPGSRVPVYDNILVDIGDEQSLQQSLSTFSAHLKRLLEMLNEASPKTLVLVDELGAGTDPEEGAALGQAIVRELLERTCPALISTHLGVLKTMAYSQPRVENACVDFDVETLRPTYHLRIGEPGNSNAINIAARLGLPEHLVERARKLLSDSHEQLSRAIRGTLQSRRQAEAARADAEAAKEQADQQRKEAERQRQALTQQQEAFQRWVQAVAALKPGDRVHVQRFDRPGQIVRLKLHKQQAVVNVGSMEIEVPLRELTIPS